MSGVVEPGVLGDPIRWGCSVARAMAMLEQADEDLATLVHLGGARTMTATARRTEGHSWPREFVVSSSEGRRLGMVVCTERGDGEAFYRAWRSMGGRFLWLSRDVRRLHWHERWPFDLSREEG